EQRDVAEKPAAAGAPSDDARRGRQLPGGGRGRKFLGGMIGRLHVVVFRSAKARPFAERKATLILAQRLTSGRSGTDRPTPAARRGTAPPASAAPPRRPRPDWKTAPGPAWCRPLPCSPPGA